ncbi:MAG: hypothetical protein JWR63_1377 [Conexibacter sp.]|nr:hypothetical protein [Conexibacter sp.]
MGETVTVDALLRDPTPAEVTEGLERNPGSGRLAERGWQPLWFEVRIAIGADHDHDFVHSLVWREPGRAAREVAEEELGHTLDEALRNLRDLEGHDVWPEDVVEPRLRVEVAERA